MITGELKSKIDSLWEIFWTGGLTNPLDVIEQMTYLMFIHDLDESDNLRAREAAMLGIPFESIFAGKVRVNARTIDGNQRRNNYEKKADSDNTFLNVSYVAYAALRCDRR